MILPFQSQSLVIVAESCRLSPSELWKFLVKHNTQALPNPLLFEVTTLKDRYNPFGWAAVRRGLFLNRSVLNHIAVEHLPQLIESVIDGARIIVELVDKILDPDYEFVEALVPLFNDTQCRSISIGLDGLYGSHDATSIFHTLKFHDRESENRYLSLPKELRLMSIADMGFLYAVVFILTPNGGDVWVLQVLICMKLSYSECPRKERMFRPITELTFTPLISEEVLSKMVGKRVNVQNDIHIVLVDGDKEEPWSPGKEMNPIFIDAYISALRVQIETNTVPEARRENIV
jgi:hypothetical protein